MTEVNISELEKQTVDSALIPPGVSIRMGKNTGPEIEFSSDFHAGTLAQDAQQGQYRDEVRAYLLRNYPSLQERDAHSVDTLIGRYASHLANQWHTLRELVNIQRGYAMRFDYTAVDAMNNPKTPQEVALSYAGVYQTMKFSSFLAFELARRYAPSHPAYRNQSAGEEGTMTPSLENSGTHKSDQEKVVKTRDSVINASIVGDVAKRLQTFQEDRLLELYFSSENLPAETLLRSSV